MKNLSLTSLITVSPRFTRSVALLRDADNPGALDGYILTPTGRSILQRLAEALTDASSTRVWSLTGPYGSGKTAFALLVAQMLGGDDAVRAKARSFLRDQDAELAAQLFSEKSVLGIKRARLCPVLITGTREPIENALARALATAIRTVSPRGRPPELVSRLESFANNSQEKRPAGKLVALYEETLSYLERYGNDASGLLLIVDELGKFLEYGASHPERGDVYILQELAECATRAKGPFLFLTILHQPLSRYAEHLSSSRRNEWGKVQGRFEDIAFEEQTEQILRLLSHAIQRSGDADALAAFTRKARSLANVPPSLDIHIGSLTNKELQGLLADCYPLHPFTSLVLGPLFRQLAQNERSLFAFLTSNEPFGFQSFLKEESNEGDLSEVFRLDRLFDYVTNALGPSLFAHRRGKVWSEVVLALERLPAASTLEIRLAKIIGLLQAIGPSCGLRSRAEVLAAALKAPGIGEDAIREALSSLTRQSIAVFRRHAGSFSLWEGSDIDLDARTQEGYKAVGDDRDLAAMLTGLVPPEPLVARRHYFQTGTLRFFEVSFVSNTTVASEIHRDLGEADGRVLLCLPSNPEERRSIHQLLRDNLGSRPIVAALPGPVNELRELAREVACLTWVLQNTPELHSDRAARKEAHARLGFAEESLKRALRRVFGGEEEATNFLIWCYHGEDVKLRGRRAINHLLSRVCEDVYWATPIWRNELINRRALSSSAAAARRNLIEAMITNADTEGLGFVGTPPERAMYETLLRGSRLHRNSQGAIGFHPPDHRAGQPMVAVWKAIEEFLDSTVEKRRPLPELFGLLKQPPFGLKEAVLPVLLAAVVLHFQSEAGLYEDDSFIPKLSVAIFERIIRTPERFSLQWFQIAGPRAEVFRKYSEMLTRNNPAETVNEVTVLNIVRPLIRFARDLPDYVGKTKQLSLQAQQVLHALKEAREPDGLLFSDLPAACGFAVFAAKTPASEAQVDAYFRKLRSAMAELRTAYPKLIEELGAIILRCFDQSGDLREARKSIAYKARLVSALAVDPKLKTFLLRIADDAGDETAWVESVASLLASRPPTTWDDQDRARFEVKWTPKTGQSNKLLLAVQERGNHAKETEVPHGGGEGPGGAGGGEG